MGCRGMGTEIGAGSLSDERSGFDFIGAPVCVCDRRHKWVGAGSSRPDSSGSLAIFTAILQRPLLPANRSAYAFPKNETGRTTRSRLRIASRIAEIGASIRKIRFRAIVAVIRDANPSIIFWVEIAIGTLSHRWDDCKNGPAEKAGRDGSPCNSSHEVFITPKPRCTSIGRPRGFSTRFYRANNSGSLAMFTAILRASSLLSNLGV
jgi:hypothetical protein